jgi:hypothetical protein
MCTDVQILLYLKAQSCSNILANISMSIKPLNNIFLYCFLTRIIVIQALAQTSSHFARSNKPSQAGSRLRRHVNTNEYELPPRVI